ncbi:TonB-dependent receptor [Phenylobacterium aquaticum]|uniref:TonB-dependent receptor n=1 Tax=Phenylobacterium aquaticum TaxID=1763816 RepID=UPI0026F0B0D3|nr:TonB-dependent receptor [Phenylobacterium aquaticum]
MKLTRHNARRAGLMMSSALCMAAMAGAANAAEAAAADTADGSATVSELVVSMAKTTRSAVSLETVEIQKILPGVSPLKAIQALPGVMLQTADPWGNNEQNEFLFVHGFSTQQLGYTLDGVPLGDQQYGNYNGLSPSRAITSENVARVVLSSGAGDLGTASTSNLGGAIDTFSSDPQAALGGRIQQTFGSYDTHRTFLRLDTGVFGDGNSAYVSGLNQDQRAWDFNGHQRGYQFNGKFIHEGEAGKLTVFLDYNDKVEPNEDSIVHVAGEKSAPYTRPFLYPNLAAALAYLGANGAPPASAGSNFSNYHSAAQRTDQIGYVKYEAKLSDTMTWSNQAYFHHDEGRGIVAGPINQAGLPALFAVYYPGQDLKTVFGGTGYAVRTTEYLINRGGLISTFNWTLGDHRIEAGAWFEQNNSSTQRAWYPFAEANHDLTPYDIPVNKNFAQYASQIHNNVFQYHLQDQWRIRPDLLLQAGFKGSLQYAQGKVPIQQKNLATNTNPTLLPTGEIDTKEYFLPQAGAVWDATEHEQVFVNVQKNLRQFVTYGAGGLSPWSLGSQAAFDLFKKTVNPETSWTYEAGLRTKHSLELGPISGVEGQLSAYHVDFSDRLLQISSTPVIGSLVAGAAILANVGSVKTDGVDLAATLHFGPHFAFYDALSYNRSIYQDNYVTGASSTVVHTAGKSVPASPDWLNKFVLSTNWGAFQGQLTGDYVGKRYATYTNDLSVKATFLIGLEGSYDFDLATGGPLKTAKVSLNVTNLADEKGVSSLVVGAASGAYNTYPIPPRQVFVTLSGSF